MAPEENAYASQVAIKIDGTRLSEEVNQFLTEVVVNQHSSLPSMFTIRLLDRTLELIDSGPFDLTKTVEISAEREDGQQYKLFKGEITSIEPIYNEGMTAELVISGYDKSHRLYRETKSKAFVNIKDSDLADQFAGAAGLSKQIEPTPIVYKHLFQHNQSDLAFLRQRAARIGYECFVEDGKLYFRKPPTTEPTVKLEWGDDLLSFRPRMSLAEQVDEVTVRGWDVIQKKPIVGRASTGELYPQVGESKNGASWASTFGKGKKLIVDQPVMNQSEADLLAKAHLNELSGAFILADGMALRRPDIKAGAKIKLEQLGRRFSGTYLVTSATHIFSPEGLVTQFTVSGSRLGLVSEALGSEIEPIDRWPGLVTAVVTDVNDDENTGRVKVKYPWLSDDQQSGWARVMGLGAGNRYGMTIIPEVGDEVMVAFLHGDFNQPIVIGGVWNGKDALPDEVKNVAANVRPLVRTWHSLKGHRITMYDNDTKKIEVFTADNSRSITMDDTNKQIIIKTPSVKITMEDSNLMIEAQGDIQIKASANLKIEAGANLEIKASGNASLQASGQLTVKGSMVNIN